VKSFFIALLVCCSIQVFGQDDTLMVKIAADTLSSDLQEGGLSAEALSLYNLALEKAGESKTDSAVFYFTEAIAAEPNFAKAYYNRGSAFLLLGNYSGALLDIDQYLNIVDTASTGYIIRAQILDELERTEDAMQAYRMAISKGDGLDVAHLALGNYSLNNQSYEEAIDHFTAYLRYHPSNANVLHDRGSAYQQMDELKSAERDYRQATLVDPQLSTAYANLGTVLRKKERYSEAVDAYSDALSIDPEDPMFLNNRGYAHFLNEDYPNAASDFEKAIEIDPDYAFAHNNLASVLIKQEKFQEAVDAADRAIQIDPEYGFAYLNRGIAREMVRDLNGACSDWEKAEMLRIKNAAQYRASICKYVEQ
jgi:tetratricopeptide (TPR) repeat protein